MCHGSVACPAAAVAAAATAQEDDDADEDDACAFQPHGKLQ